MSDIEIVSTPEGVTTWTAFVFERPPFGEELEIAYTIAGMGNTLYRIVGQFSPDGSKFLSDYGADLGAAELRYWRKATPLPNNGLFPGDPNLIDINGGH